MHFPSEGERIPLFSLPLSFQLCAPLAYGPYQKTHHSLLFGSEQLRKASIMRTSSHVVDFSKRPINSK